jgi:hypothetical protein
MGDAMAAVPESPFQSTTSRNAIASLFLAVVSCSVPALLALPVVVVSLLSWLPIIGWHAVQVTTAVAGAIAGLLGLKDIRRSQGRMTGRGLAWTGIGISFAATFLIMPPVLLLRVLPVALEARNQKLSMTRLKAIVSAMHQYHDTYSQFPPAVVSSREGKPLYSWRVLLLPFLGQKKLYEQFRLDEPWDSPANQPLLEQMPAEYAPPSGPFPPADFATHYMVFDGPEAVFQSAEPPKWLNDPLNQTRISSYQVYPQRPGERAVYNFGKSSRIASITDGTSGTILLVEADERVPWTKPQDVAYAANQPLPRLGGLYRGAFLVAMADGSVRIVSKKTSEKTIRAAITANGGEILDPDWDTP